MNRSTQFLLAVMFFCTILAVPSVKSETVFLDAETITTGIISLKFNSAQGGGQILKISLEVLDLEHKVLKGSGKFISLPELAEFKSVDADPERWQIVSIPVLKYLQLSGIDPGKIRFIDKISIQHNGAVPETDLMITEIHLKLP